MKDLRTLIGNIGWLLVDRFSLMAFNLVTIFLVANHYGAIEYGYYQYATSIVIILDVAVQLLDGRVVKMQYGHGNDAAIVFNMTIGKAILSAATLFMGIIVAFASSKGLTFSIILAVLLLDSILKNLRFGMENRFEYSLLSKKVVIATDIGLIINLVFQFLTVKTQLPITVIAYIQALSTAISLFVLKYQYVIYFGRKRTPNLIDTNLIRRVFVDSLPLAIAGAAAVIYTRSDTVMLGLMLSSKEVGIYSIAARFISALQLLIIPIHTTVFVKMIDYYGNEEYEKKYISVTSLCTWICIVGVLLSFVVIPKIFVYIKPEFLPAIESYKILTIGSIFAYNAILRSGHFTLTGNGSILMITQIVTVVLNIILNWSLIPIWGMNGAAIATAVSQFVSLFISNFFFKDARFVLKAQIKGFNPLYLGYAIKDLLMNTKH